MKISNKLLVVFLYIMLMLGGGAATDAYTNQIVGADKAAVTDNVAAYVQDRIRFGKSSAPSSSEKAAFAEILEATWGDLDDSFKTFLGYYGIVGTDIVAEVNGAFSYTAFSANFTSETMVKLTESEEKLIKVSEYVGEMMLLKKHTPTGMNPFNSQLFNILLYRHPLSSFIQSDVDKAYAFYSLHSVLYNYEILNSFDVDTLASRFDTYYLLSTNAGQFFRDAISSTLTWLLVNNNLVSDATLSNLQKVQLWIKVVQDRANELGATFDRTENFNIFQGIGVLYATLEGLSAGDLALFIKGTGKDSTYSGTLSDKQISQLAYDVVLSGGAATDAYTNQIAGEDEAAVTANVAAYVQDRIRFGKSSAPSSSEKAAFAEILEATWGDLDDSFKTFLGYYGIVGSDIAAELNNAFGYVSFSANFTADIIVELTESEELLIMVSELVGGMIDINTYTPANAGALNNRLFNALLYRSDLTLSLSQGDINEAYGFYSLYAAISNLETLMELPSSSLLSIFEMYKTLTSHTGQFILYETSTILTWLIANNDLSSDSTLSNLQKAQLWINVVQDRANALGAIFDRTENYNNIRDIAILYTELAELGNEDLTDFIKGMGMNAKYSGTLTNKQLSQLAYDIVFNSGAVTDIYTDNIAGGADEAAARGKIDTFIAERIAYIRDSSPLILALFGDDNNKLVLQLLQNSNYNGIPKGGGVSSADINTWALGLTQAQQEDITAKGVAANELYTELKGSVGKLFVSSVDLMKTIFTIDGDTITIADSNTLTSKIELYDKIMLKSKQWAGILDITSGGEREWILEQKDAEMISKKIVSAENVFLEVGVEAYGTEGLFENEKAFKKHIYNNASDAEYYKIRITLLDTITANSNEWAGILKVTGDNSAWVLLQQNPKTFVENITSSEAIVTLTGGMVGEGKLFDSVEDFKASVYGYVTDGKSLTDATAFFAAAEALYESKYNDTNFRTANNLSSDADLAVYALNSDNHVVGVETGDEPLPTWAIVFLIIGGAALLAFVITVIVAAKRGKRLKAYK